MTQEPLAAVLPPTPEIVTSMPFCRPVVFPVITIGDAFVAPVMLPLMGLVGSAAMPSLGMPGSGMVAPGVHIAGVVEDPSPPLKRYDPGHPDAGPDGYVSYPDINPLTEMVDLMGATRAYGLNSSAVQAEKGMITSALEIAKS